MKREYSDETKRLGGIDRAIAELIREAIEAEREACAELVMGFNVEFHDVIAAAIRARGAK